MPLERSKIPIPEGWEKLPLGAVLGRYDQKCTFVVETLENGLQQKVTVNWSPVVLKADAEHTFINKEEFKETVFIRKSIKLKSSFDINPKPW